MKGYCNPMVPELSVSNFSESLIFYRDVLGFIVLNQRSNPNFAYLEYEKIQIMIEQVHEDAWITGKLEFPLGRGINFQIQIENLSPILSRLESSQICLFKKTQDSWYDTGEKFRGQREVLVQDPDGYLLRFTQFLGEKDKPKVQYK